MNQASKIMNQASKIMTGLMFLLVILPISALAQGGTASIYFAQSGSTEKIVGPLNRTGSAGEEFTLDVIYTDDADVGGLLMELHFDSSVLEFVCASEIADAAISGASIAPNLGMGTTYAGCNNDGAFMPVPEGSQQASRVLPEDADDSTDSVIFPGWVAFVGTIFDATPIKLFKVHFSWKPDADKSSTTIGFTSSGNDGNITMNDYSSLLIDFAPLVLSSALENQRHKIDEEIAQLTLPEATGGTGALTYTLYGPNGNDLSEVPGLMFDASTRILSGTPDTEATTILTYGVADTDGRSYSQTFDFMVFDNQPPMPVDTIPDMTLTADSADGTVGMVGTVDVTPYFSDDEGDTLTFSAMSADTTIAAVDVSDSIVTVTPGKDKAGSTTITVTANDGQTATQTFTVTVVPVPLVLSSALVDQRYILDREIAPLILPIAGGGTGLLTYTLTGSNSDNAPYWLPAGLLFDDTTRTLSGIPTMTVTTTLTYKVADTSGQSVRQIFMVEVTKGLSPGDIVKLNKAIAPRLVQSAVASTVAAVGNRIEIAFSGTPQTANYQLDGQTVQIDGKTRLSANLQETLLKKLPVHARAMADGTMDWKQVLGNSSFALPLNASDGAGNGVGAGDSNLAIWGSGNYQKMKGEGDIDWNGDVVSVQLGVDNRVRDDLLVGGMLSLSEGDTDYTQNGQKGEYTLATTSVHPYLAWSREGISLWGSAGYGKGKLELKEETRKTQTDTNLLSLAAGVKGALSEKPGLSIKGDLSLVRTNIEAQGGIIDEQRIDSQRLRVLLESARARRLASGSMFTPIMELGLRYDGGDGDNGVGVLLGAGARYANNRGMSVQGKLHALVGRDDYKEWGVSGVIRQEMGSNGRGLAFSLSPSYGSGNTDTLWQNHSAGKQKATDDNIRLDVAIRYGLSAPGGRGLLTPYSETTLARADDRYRLGLRWKRNSRLDMNLFAEEQAGKRKVQLESSIRF